MIPLDAWGNEFIYLGPDKSEDKKFEIISTGKDGKLGTNDDISSKRY